MLIQPSSLLQIVENSVMQKKARLMTKLPEIQKAYDIVNTLLEKASQPNQEAIIDYELADAVYARTKVSHVKTVNLWLGAGVMVEYSLEEAKVGYNCHGC
jgi:prefoldin subunit 5